MCIRDRQGAALVFRGDDGLDELSTTAPSQVWVVADGSVRHERVDAASLDLPVATLKDLRGGDAAHNAAVLRDLLAGKPGPVRDAVLLNAAAAVVAADGPAGPLPLLERLRTALVEVAEAVDCGAAAAVLDRWVAASQG